MEHGTPFGRYELLDLLGRGGMGEVWRAYDTATERVVALKVLPVQFAGDAVFQERFRREARSAAALDEPHVVPIYDFGEIDGRLYVTMRLIKGRDLHSILRDGAISADRAVAIIDQIGAALHAAHQAGLVHRDVKPSNILVTDDDFAYLIDFGIARAANQTGLTSTAGVIGTWAYLAPERVSTGQTDARADIYALTCVLYECLTGSQPFPGDSLEQQVGGHLALPPPRPSDRLPDTPSELDTVVARGMAKNPDDRYATTRELTRAARAAVNAPAIGPNTLPATAVAPLAPPSPQDGTLTGPTQHAPVSRFPNAPGPAKSRKGRLIALGSTAAVLAVVAVATIALTNSDDHGTSPSGATPAAPTALPNTGPFTGTFTAAAGQRLMWDGSPLGSAGDAAYSESWKLRSACSANGCVATAVTGGRYAVKDLVFDDADGNWVAVSTTRGKCRAREDDEVWNVIVLHPQPNGSMGGEFTQITANGCASKRTATLTRTADADISRLADPTTLARRVISPAAALRGSYKQQVTYPNGNKFTHTETVRTDCLRTGDRCISRLTNEKGGGETLVFGNGAWTRNEVFDSPCPSGGSSIDTWTSTLPLPTPPQDPIPTLTGHGYDEAGPGTKCHSWPFEILLNRTGD
ncbi:serine/threonine-protein kinase [Mycobacterium sp. Z3061]|uniref:serine/threonine-protein kinase n=1 Tax=Mycobacterium sp. Z3061 TaxID=3073562 RepID=UPI002872CC9C|nr:serine/threonine-protein kinase [Mycobacterium sp. Z3061]